MFATFKVRLPKPVLVQGESGRPIVVETTLNNWCAEVVLTPNTRLGRIRQQDGRWYHMVSEGEVTISRNEEMLIEEDELAPLFEKEYRDSALDLVHRLEIFLRLKAKLSLLKAIDAYEIQMQEQAEPPALALTVVEPLVPDWMVGYLYDQYSPELCHQFLDAAQVSIDCQRSRRAALELAMACEAALGLRIYSSAFARASMGDRFREQYPEQYQHISQLFEHKEFLTHKGLGFFNFAPAAKRQAWLQQLNEQKAALGCLLNWLSGEDVGVAL